MFKPIALNPPSANKNPCISRTTVRAKVAAHGPTSTAANAPPSKCPLVPAPTGKFNICTAKINTAVSPANGALLSSSSFLAPLRETPTQMAAAPAKIAEV